MLQVDLAGENHWDQIYRVAGSVRSGWYPTDYDALTLERALLTEIARYKPESLFEVGCGNSVWLPYLARKTGLKVAGMDYSEIGCKMARQRLLAEEVPGRIFCMDLFEASPDEVGQHGFVFSLGLVEHFTNPEGVLAKLLEFVRPGGVLFTEIPNLWSIHGLLSWLWQPELLAKHYLISKRQLVRAYKRLDLEKVHGCYLGLFSLNIVAWEHYPRWPNLVPLIVPLIRRIHRRTNAVLCRINKFDGIAPLAPFMYVAGQKPVKKG